MYREFRPDPQLRPFVDCGWLLSGSASSIRVIPDGSMDVFVTGQGQVMVAGPATTFYDLAVDGEVMAGLRLRPGAASAMIGCPASDFTNMRVPLESIFGLKGLRIAASLLGATTPDRRMSLPAGVFARYFAGSDRELGRRIAHNQVHIFTIADGKITRHRAVRDDLELLFQLGAKLVNNARDAAATSSSSQDGIGSSFA